MRKNSSYSLNQNFQFSSTYTEVTEISSPTSVRNLQSNRSTYQTPKSFLNIQPTISQRKKFVFETDSTGSCRNKIKPFLRHTTYITKGDNIIDKLSISTEGETLRNNDIRNKQTTDFRSTVYRSPENQYRKKCKTYGKQQYDEIASKVHQTTTYIQQLKKMKVQRIKQEDQLNAQELDQIESLQFPKPSNSKNISINFKKKKEYNVYTPKPETMVCTEKFKRGYTPNINFKKQISPSHRRKLQNCLISDFVFGKMLGGGKFGTVFQAIHVKTKSIYALKKVSKKKLKQYNMINQFCLETKLQTYLKHDNILQLYGVFDDEENIYLILEFMEEGTLYSILKKKKKLTQFEVSNRLSEITKAIFHLHHNGITHRDIKPQNIVISNGVCKLCDFGWATFCNERRKTYCGTFDYAAPEVLEGIEYDMSVDIWCLGILAYELLVGKSPFYHLSKKETITKIINVQTKKIDYPPTLSWTAVSFIQSLLKKNPNQRPIIDQVIKHPFLKLGENSI